MAETAQAAAPNKRRGKTRDAFGGKYLLGVSKWINFTALDGSAEKDLSRSELKQIYFAQLYNLSEGKNRVTNHLRRLEKYRTALMVTDSTETQKILKKFVRLSDCIRVYEVIFAKLIELEAIIGSLIDNLDKIDFREGFASRLRIARKTAELTQEELALRIGIKRSTYGQFEQGRNEPNVSLLPKLSRELNRPVEWLLGMTP